MSCLFRIWLLLEIRATNGTEGHDLSGPVSRRLVFFAGGYGAASVTVAQVQNVLAFQAYKAGAMVGQMEPLRYRVFGFSTRNRKPYS